MITTPATVSVVRKGSTSTGPAPEEAAEQVECAHRGKAAAPKCLADGVVRQQDRVDGSGRISGAGGLDDDELFDSADGGSVSGDTATSVTSAPVSLSASSAMSRNTRAGSVPDSSSVAMSRVACIQDCSGAGLVVEPGVVDGDARRRRQRLGQHLVVVTEGLPVGLLGQVQVAVDLVADAHRNPEEGAHRRVIGREADRGRVVVNVVKSDRAGLVDEHAQHAATLRQVADLFAGGLVDAFVDELDQFVVLSAHSERSVPGVDQIDGGVHDRLQRGVEIQAGGHRQHRRDEPVDAVALLDDLLDTDLHLGEQFAQPQLREIPQWPGGRAVPLVA